MRPSNLPALMLALFFSVPAFADDEAGKIYTCPDAGGALVYQDEPCDATPVRKAPAARTAVATKPVPVPKSRPAATAPAATSTVRSRPAAASLPVRPALTNVAWEPTWRAFVDAMRSGDGPAAIRCLTSSALTELGPRIQSSAPEALRGMVESFERVVVEGDLGPYWSIRVLRPGSRPKWVFFERTARGEWKIAAI